MNKIVVNFAPCTPTPPGGYKVFWRVAGSEGEYTDADNFFMSPAVFYDTINPAGTCYEGFIKANCGDILGNVIPWQSCGSGEPVIHTLTFAASVAGTFTTVFAYLSQYVDVDVEIVKMVAYGFDDGSCTPVSIAFVSADNKTIPAGTFGVSGADSISGDWTIVNSYHIQECNINVAGGYSGPVNDGDVIVMGSFAVTIKFLGC